jgi:hypothetical protein
MTISVVLLADAEQTELKLGDFGLMTKYGPGMKNYSQGGVSNHPVTMQKTMLTASYP